METQTWQFTSFCQLEGVIKRVDEPQEVILLLHGLGERGKRIFRKLAPHLPTNALIIAPNGPFPLPRNKAGRLDFGHSWYFYDKYEAKYFVNMDLAKYWLHDLLKIENPRGLPLTIIGFSQGGYLAAPVGAEIKETKLVIGLACEFKASLVHEKPDFSIVAVHGENDEIISTNSALVEIDKLKKLGISVKWHTVPATGHEISHKMGQVVKKILEQYGKNSL